MKRRSFFKSILVGAGALAFAPTVFIQPEIAKDTGFTIISTKWGDLWLRKEPLFNETDDSCISLECQVFDTKTLKLKLNNR